MTLSLQGRVAIVTGAGGGLGRSYALLLARYGAKVVVNDVGGDRSGLSASSSPAKQVVAEIEALGGTGMADRGDVTDFHQMEAMVAAAEDRWGRVDILINNAGILRDRTFAKMDLDDFRKVIDVHLMGSVNATKAVWTGMSARGCGRVVLTTSSSGLFGNFGQSNYSAAKMALVGLMRTLSQEGRKFDIRVNCISPTAATRLTGDLLNPELAQRLTPEAVAPGVIALCADSAPTGAILCAGAGSFELANITLTRGLRLPIDENLTEQLLDRMDEVSDRAGEMTPSTGWEQSRWELDRGAEQDAVDIRNQ